jgi:hypothetical protein
MNAVLSSLLKIEHYNGGFETTYLLAPSQFVLLSDRLVLHALSRSMLLAISEFAEHHTADELGQTEHECS